MKTNPPSTGRSWTASLLALLLLVAGVVVVSAQTSRIAPAGSEPDVLSNCNWTAPAAAPAPLLDAPTATVGSNLYLFGGVQNGAQAANSFKFDGTTWTPIAPLPQTLEFPSAVTDGTNVYILG